MSNSNDRMSAPPPPAPQPKSPWPKRIAIGCAGAAVVIAVLVGVTTLIVRKATAGPEAVVHEFLAAAGSGDYPKAYSYFAAPLKQIQPLSEFQAAASARSSFFRAKDTTFNERSIDTAGAKLSGSLTLESGTRMPASFQLVRENGVWKLIGYHIGS